MHYMIFEIRINEDFDLSWKYIQSYFVRMLTVFQVFDVMLE